MRMHSDFICLAFTKAERSLNAKSVAKFLQPSKNTRSTIEGCIRSAHTLKSAHIAQRCALKKLCAFISSICTVQSETEFHVIYAANSRRTSTTWNIISESCMRLEFRSSAHTPGAIKFKRNLGTLIVTTVKYMARKHISNFSKKESVREKAEYKALLI